MLRTRARIAVTAAIACSFACTKPALPQDVLDELKRMQERERIVIGRISRLEVHAIVLAPVLSMKRYQLSETEAKEIEAVSRRTNERGSNDETNRQRSPDGKWLIRQVAGERVLASSDGSTQRTLSQMKGVLTQVRWSPDSEYLMWIEKSNPFDLSQLPDLDDSCDVMIYRIRDWQGGRVYQVTRAYPYIELDWLTMPSTVRF